MKARCSGEYRFLEDSPWHHVERVRNGDVDLRASEVTRGVGQCAK